MSTFLASKHGYCVQFASAMAVMARTLGIPARLGVGFLPGTKQSNGRQGVSLNDAHAWPELYFEGIGWVRFEPTPRVRTGAAPAYSQPSHRHHPVRRRRRRPTRDSAVRRRPARRAPRGHAAPEPGHRGRGVRQPVRLPPPGEGLGPARLLLVGARWRRRSPRCIARWRRRRRARDADARAEAAWAELLERVDDLGHRPAGRRHAAPDPGSELVDRGPAPDEPAEALARLVQAIERVRYAPRPAAAAVDGRWTGPSRGRTTWPRWPRAVRAGRDRSSRLRARVLPRSGTERLVGLSARAGERIAGVDRRIARTGRRSRGPRPGSIAVTAVTRVRRKMFGRRTH